MMGNKLTKQITFKPRIDLSRFAARSPTAAAQPLSYRLVSMVTHLGVSQNCGHYTAIGLTEAGSYYNFDDSYVRPIAIQSVCNTNAYIMFYELDVANNNSVGPKLNGVRLSNGQHSPATATVATATSTASVTSASVVTPRFIGPQLPNGYANSNGHALGGGGGGVKTAIQFKTTPQKQTQQQQQSPQQQQNGLLTGAGKFQESSQSKHSLASTLHKGEAAAVANSNANKSSCNTNNLTNNNQQQQILPMSSDEEEEDEDSDDDDVKANKAPQLPSMPRMFEDSSDSVAQTAKLKTPKTPLKSLVPYESASEEEEQQIYYWTSARRTPLRRPLMVTFHVNASRIWATNARDARKR